MAELKTKASDASVSAFLQSVDGEQKRRDARDILALMKEETGKRPRCGERALSGLEVTTTSIRAVERAVGSLRAFPRESKIWQSTLCRGSHAILH